MKTVRTSRAVLVAVVVLAAACTPTEGAEDVTTTESLGVTTTTPSSITTTVVDTTTTGPAETTTTGGTAHDQSDEPDPSDVAAASLANAGFQDVALAEAAGYASTMDDLGCFESPETGGMGLHYLNGGLMDATLDVATPEALVYELDANGDIAGLVAHEYIVPVEAWTETDPPSLFGMELHQHPVLPLWVLHTWLWKDNPSGFFNDWNPAVRMCPDGVPVFGTDLP